MKTVILDFDIIFDQVSTAVKTVKDAIKEMYAMGVTLALTSDRGKEIVEDTLNEHNLSNYFSVIVTADDAKATSGNEDQICAILAHTDTEPSQVLAVSNNMSNIGLSKKAGIKTCMIKTDNFTSSTDADYTIDDIRDLLDIV